MDKLALEKSKTVPLEWFYAVQGELKEEQTNRLKEV